MRPGAIHQVAWKPNVSAGSLSRSTTARRLANGARIGSSIAMLKVWLRKRKALHEDEQADDQGILRPAEPPAAS